MKSISTNGLVCGVCLVIGATSSVLAQPAQPSITGAPGSVSAPTGGAVVVPSSTSSTPRALAPASSSATAAPRAATGPVPSAAAVQPMASPTPRPAPVAVAQNRTPAAATNRTAAVAPARNQAVQELALPVNGQVALTLAGSPVRVSVADPAVADVQVLPPTGGARGEVLLLGKQPGSTQVQVWSRGSSTPQVWAVRVISQAQNVLDARGVATGVAADGGGAGKTVLSGRAPSAIGHAAAVAAAGGPEAVVDASMVDGPGVVQVEVKVVELSRSALKQVGVNFRAGQGGPWSGATSVGNTAGSTAIGSGVSAALGSGFNLLYATRNVGVALNLLQENGMARMLAEPTLVALSGQSASFLAGGEIPVPEAGGLGTQSVSYKPFGIGLTVTPTVLARNRIALRVAPEASELDYTNGIAITNGDTSSIIPALRTRRADTMVELGDGESFVISGLVSRATISSVQKVPLLGDLPIIGAFFRSLQYSQEDRELVIMVTPRLVRPIAAGVTLPLPGARQEVTDSGFNAWGKYLLGPLSNQDMPGFSR